jgi:para-aminobenzoate synthetase
LRTLLIDNHDSYTFNLFQLIAAVNGCEPAVYRNDDVALATLPLDGFDNIVISPGPGHPAEARDLGHVGDLLARTDLPVLGVCLGHQALAHLAGGDVRPAPQPRHGFLETVRHDGDALFAGIPAEFTAVRYHSLCVQQPLPAGLTATAWAQDGVVMALRHDRLPRWGVQFHPESISSEYGRELLANFRDLSTGARRRAGGTGLRLAVEELPGAIDAEAAFAQLFANSPDAFWLDSSRVEPGLSRFSFLGDASGPLGEVITYDVEQSEIRVRTPYGEKVTHGDVFALLDDRLQTRRVPGTTLPFDFSCGYVGWFGYEMKADCGATAAHAAETPDAAWIFAGRMVAVDHEREVTYLLAAYDDDPGDAKRWITETAGRLHELSTLEAVQQTGAAPAAADHLVRDRTRYLADIRESQRQLALGESYEICVTDNLRLPFHEDDLAYYRRLRRVNPAPYAALLRIAGTTVFSSSPERFLRITPDGTVETKPIKGTAPRGEDPLRDAVLAAELAASPKTRAENLMIVDLLRNDLGQVCEIGSVTVDRFMAVESYATVHQLVSTVSGRLRPDVSPIGCVRHCFPGGSMTGAPKLRTMEIIDRLETEARGIYSGTLGYFGLTGGADLNIVIRTAVRTGDLLTIGAGGAIVLDSDPVEEYEEMLLKAQAPLRAYR